MDKKKELDDAHIQSLKSSRIIINQLIDRLSVIIEKEEFDEIDNDEWKILWGEKENVTSLMTKLTTILFKLIPLEKQINEKLIVDTQSDNNLSIKDNDREIIRRYIKKYSNTEKK